MHVNMFSDSCLAVFIIEQYNFEYHFSASGHVSFSYLVVVAQLASLTYRLISFC